MERIGPLSYQKHASFGTPLRTFYMKHYHLKMMMMIQKPQLKDFFQEKVLSFDEFSKYLTKKIQNPYKFFRNL